MKTPPLLVAAALLSCAIPAQATEPAGPSAGTTVVGERETALGLVLTPWQEEGPAALDRPPSILDEAPESVDAESLARTSRFERDLAGWRRARVEHTR